MMLNASTAGHCGAKVRRDKTRVFQPPYRPATPAISRTNIPPLLWSGGDYYGRLESSNVDSQATSDRLLMNSSNR